MDIEKRQKLMQCSLAQNPTPHHTFILYTCKPTSGGVVKISSSGNSTREYNAVLGKDICVTDHGCIK